MTEPAKRSNHNGRTVFIVVLASLVLIGGLRMVSLERASSKDQGHDAIPTPVASSTEGCTTWANYWISDSGVGASQSALEGFTNCRLSNDGTWIVPDFADDPRLPNPPVLTPEEREQTEALRESILSQVRSLEERFPKGLQDQMGRIYSDTNRPVVGHIKDTESISSTRARYNRLAQAVLMNPANDELAEYVGWMMSSRQAAFGEFLRSCERKELQYLWVACRGVGDSLSVFFPPFPWDLTNEYNLETYLKWAVANGKVPAA